MWVTITELRKENNKMEEDYQNVFQKACLIQLSTSIWTGSRMLDQTLMTKVSQNL